jgi:hypothetical protein
MTSRLTKVDGTSSPTVSTKQKRLSHYSPAFEFVHLFREKKCYSLYGATSELDHFSLTWFVATLMPNPHLTA